MRVQCECSPLPPPSIPPLTVSAAVTEADQAVLKEAHASLMTLALEAARTDSDTANIRYSTDLVLQSQTVTLAVTVWTTAVERFVLSSPGSRVGDKCEQYLKGHESHYLLAKV